MVPNNYAFGMSGSYDLPAGPAPTEVTFCLVITALHKTYVTNPVRVPIQ